MYDTYEDACCATVSATVARREIVRHCADWTDFIAEYGIRPAYSGQDVLDFLGY